MNNLFSLEGKVAIVTGGNGSIGSTYVQALATHGADVAIFDYSSEGTEELLHVIGKLGKRAKFYPIDLKDHNQILFSVDRVMNDFGKIDILVNHAGINIRKPALDFTTYDWEQVMDINLKAMFFMAQTVGKEMITQKSGKIINTASVSSVRGHPRLAIYAASKGGVVQMTKVLAHEWAPYGVNVNAIGPGYIRTHQTTAFLEDEQTYQSIVGKIPMQRVGTPEDLVGGLIYLASSASDYVTGQTLYIEGGRLID